ncbi:cation-transporting P-type ATPase [Kordia sp. YSTF-M3]|uniref:Cation-transporting P-type ATPase n=1 Tax=Kordia aestuariivivens TaxID=2759037 RepID=A0ABR7QBV6_9FLAO|nr:cation-transporting P-type ATPase [Kordia aestuariivivens]MBC8755873.1 cation-transporting P-type ATPase [Kordia aestuariivivens]
MILEPFAIHAKTVAQKLSSSIQFGLTNEETQHRIKEFGTNDIPEKKKKSRWKILIDQFIDPIILILALATFFTFLFSPDLLETIAILMVILITVGIGFIMELQGIRSLEALRKMGYTASTVLRDGKIQMIPSTLLVPGDIIFIETGDIISADARLISVENLSIKEALLTGESTAVNKDLSRLAKNTPLTERSNMVFKGTSVIQGSAKAIVTHTGFHTQLGKIQKMSAVIGEQRTPLEKKLNELSKWLIWLTLIFAILIFFTGYLRGMDIIEILKTTVALAVAAIPEGLPIVATIALARGMLKLSKQKVIIKKMEAVETLGATNIICTDKTGTLTEDRMQVHTMAFEDELLSKIQNKEYHFFDHLLKKKSFNTMMKASILCNNVALGAMNKRGDSIELALIEFAEKLKLDLKKIKKNNPEVLEIPFDTNSKLMVTLNQNVVIGATIYVKGAFESLVNYCDTILRKDKIQEFTNKKEWFTKVNKLASQGLRILGFAYRDVAAPPIKEDLLSNLTFIGVIAFLDPARDDVKSTIKIYKDAGIKVVMLTGDHPGTAKKIAEEVGLLGKDSTTDGVIHGKDLELTEELDTTNKEKLLNASVFARVTPEQKLKVIALYQKNNNIVGMFGDGVNDIPALRKADIGIAMGIRGTQAARESADIILKNDRFTAMELAIKQGRAVFDHIRQFVVYLLSCNLAEVVSVGLAALLNLPAPLLPLQILFLNLITDIFPALALGMGKGEVDIMKRPPRKANEPIMTPKLWSSTIIYGLCITAAVVGITAYSHFALKASPSEINNMAFFTLLLAQLFNVFNMSKTEVPFFSNEVIKNPWVWGAFIVSIIITVGAYSITPVADALHLTSLSIKQFGWVIVFTFGSLVLSQLMKRLGFTF